MITNKISGANIKGGFGLIWMRFVMAGFLILALLLAMAFGLIAAVLVSVLVGSFAAVQGVKYQRRNRLLNIQHQIAMDRMYNGGAKAKFWNKLLRIYYQQNPSDRPAVKKAVVRQTIVKETKMANHKLRLATAK
ncbi:MAG: hypothetical protein WCI79_02925 [Candidatus Saccharibacteria bacterium]